MIVSEVDAWCEHPVVAVDEWLQILRATINATALGVLVPNVPEAAWVLERAIVNLGLTSETDGRTCAGRRRRGNEFVSEKDKIESRRAMRGTA
jgi:hypothetical protein